LDVSVAHEAGVQKVRFWINIGEQVGPLEIGKEAELLIASKGGDR